MLTAAIGSAHADGWRDDDDRLAQVAELGQLHATFRAAVSVHDPVNGDSPTLITQRIREALAIWTEDAELNTAAGNYVGKGDPDDPASCPPPSGDTSPTGQQGTLCTFFKYVSGGLQPTNKFVSLSPAYETKFVPVKDDDGEWKSSVYFECHYCDVSLNPATGQPFWTAKSHIDLNGEAKKVNGRWLLTHVSSSAVPVQVPSNRTPDARACQGRSACIRIMPTQPVYRTKWTSYGAARKSIQVESRCQRWALIEILSGY